MKYVAISLLLLVAVGCKKLNPLSNINNILQTIDDSIPAAVTDIGTPTGTAVTKNIGGSGGSIVSDDGRIEVDIPAGALSANTNITIQPVTNNCPGGSGFAYDLLPNGTRFAVPATFIFHYADSDVNGTDPYLFFLAVQDSVQQWDVDVYRDVDTIAHTVSFDLNHFSVRSMVAGLLLAADPDVHIEAPKTDFYPSEQGTLRMVKNVRDSYLQPSDEDELPGLPITTPVPDNLVSGWQVTGGSANGSIAANGSKATYTAPSKINKDRTITVSAGYGKGGMVTVYAPSRKSRSTMSVQRTITQFYKPLNLHAAISFHVKITFDPTGTSGVYADNYHDECYFRVDVKGIVVTIPKDSITNQAPTVTNSPGVGANGSTATWIPDKVGEINIVSGMGTLAGDLDPNGARIVSLTFSEPGALEAGWTITNSKGISTSTQPAPSPGVPLTMKFSLIDSYQVIDPFEGLPAAGTLKYVINPID